MKFLRVIVSGRCEALINVHTWPLLGLWRGKDSIKKSPIFFKEFSTFLNILRSILAFHKLLNWQIGKLILYCIKRRFQLDLVEWGDGKWVKWLAYREEQGLSREAGCIISKRASMCVRAWHIPKFIPRFDFRVKAIQNELSSQVLTDFEEALSVRGVKVCTNAYMMWWYCSLCFVIDKILTPCMVWFDLVGVGVVWRGVVWRGVVCVWTCGVVWRPVWCGWVYIWGGVMWCGCGLALRGVVCVVVCACRVVWRCGVWV